MPGSGQRAAINVRKPQWQSSPGGRSEVGVLGAGVSPAALHAPCSRGPSPLPRQRQGSTATCVPAAQRVLLKTINQQLAIVSGDRKPHTAFEMSIASLL